MGGNLSDKNEEGCGGGGSSHVSHVDTGEYFPASNGSTVDSYFVFFLLLLTNSYIIRCSHKPFF